MKTFGENLIESAAQALSDIQGNEISIRENTFLNVEGIRSNLEMSQVNFSQTFQIPLATLQKWEMGTATPSKTSIAYLKVISKEPEVVKKSLVT